jgi:hypothetical protein
MSDFTFEIVRNGETAVFAGVLTLSEERSVWREVEALALLIKSPDGASIRVKNSMGETVVRTGVRTALASIEKCLFTNCPLKKGIEGRFSSGGRVAIEFPVHFVPCGGQAGRYCKAGGLSQDLKERSLAGEARQ